jgi:PAS domain S-box-containing protein
MVLNTTSTELRDVCIVLVATIGFTIFSVSVSLIHKIEKLFDHFTALPVGELIINVSFLVLAGLLWLTYPRWREASEKKAELENIVDSISPDVLLVVNPNRNITMCNKSVNRMFGYSVDEVLNQKTDVLYFDRRENPHKRHEIYEMLESEGFHVGLATGRKRNGQTVPLEIVTGRLSKGNGAVLLLRDITERKGVEEERMKRERMEGILETAGAVCHKLNQPLQSISGFSDLVMMEVEEGNSLHGYAKGIKNQVQRMGELTMALLTIEDRYKIISNPEGREPNIIEALEARK